MIVSLIVAGAVLTLKPDVWITEADARRIAPAELGNLLLAPEHPPVTEIMIGSGGGPPLPPNAPPTTFVTLFTKPVAGEDGFCRRDIARIILHPRSEGLPSTISTRTGYRWTGSPGACDGPKATYFQPEPAATLQAMRDVRRLVDARKRAIAGMPLTFSASIVDEYASAMREAGVGSDDPDMVVITDARAALARLPVDAISWVGPQRELLDEADLNDGRGGKLRYVSFFAGGLWTVSIALDGERIVRLRMRRAIPAPF